MIHLNIPHVTLPRFWTSFLDLWSCTDSFLYAGEDYFQNAEVSWDATWSELWRFYIYGTLYFRHLDSWLLFSYTTTWSVGHFSMVETVRGIADLRTVERWICLFSLLPLLDLLTLHMRVNLMMNQLISLYCSYLVINHFMYHCCCSKYSSISVEFWINSNSLTNTLELVNMFASTSTNPFLFAGVHDFLQHWYGFRKCNANFKLHARTSMLYRRKGEPFRAHNIKKNWGLGTEW